jgi:formylglycine-generating enzyme required for sulfatase activity
VLRGGGWGYKENAVRAANRYRYAPSDWDIIIGFRCAR